MSVILRPQTMQPPLLFLKSSRYWCMSAFWSSVKYCLTLLI